MSPAVCRRARNRLLPRAADHELSPLEALELAGHLACCPGCRLVEARQAAAHEAFARLPEIPPPADLPQRIMERIRALGPGARQFVFALAALGGSAGIWLASGGGRDWASPSLPILPDLGRAATEAALEFGRTLVLFVSEAPFALLAGSTPSASPFLNTLLILALGAGAVSLIFLAWLLALVPSGEPLDRR